MRSHPLLKKILSVPSYGQRPDVGLLVLRIGIFASLFIKHGLEKIDPASFAEMAPTFPDPAHIGHVPSLLVATVSDGFCSVLIVLGLFTRPAAAYIFAVLSVAWSVTHHFMYLGKGIEPKHGELIEMYITASLAVVLLGPGKYSLDRLIWGKAAN